MLSINTASVKKQMTKIVTAQIKEEDEIELRTLNAVSKKAKSIVAKQLADETGLTQATIKRSIKVTKASKGAFVVFWRISGKRLQPPGLRAVKRKKRIAGISYLGKGKKRIVKMQPIGSGSKPFIIPGKYSGKKLAVFRQPGNPRHVTTYAWQSLPFLLEKDWERRLKEEVKRLFPAERLIQKKKVKFLRGKK